MKFGVVKLHRQYIKKSEGCKTNNKSGAFKVVKTKSKSDTFKAQLSSFSTCKRTAGEK